MALSRVRRQLCVRIIDAGKGAAECFLSRSKQGLRRSKQAIASAKILRFASSAKSLARVSRTANLKSASSAGVTAGDGDPSSSAFARKLTFDDEPGTSSISAAPPAVDMFNLDSTSDMLEEEDWSDDEYFESTPGESKGKDSILALQKANKVCSYLWPAICASRAAGGSTGLESLKLCCSLLHNTAADEAANGDTSAAARLQFVCALAWNSILELSFQTGTLADQQTPFIPSSELIGAQDEAAPVSPSISDSLELHKPLQAAAAWFDTTPGSIAAVAKFSARYESAARCAAQANRLPEAIELAQFCMSLSARIGAMN